MTHRGIRTLSAIVGVLVVCAGLIAGFGPASRLVIVEGVGSTDPYFFVVLAGYVLSTVMLAWLGSVLSIRVSENPIGGIFLALGTWQAVTLFSSVALSQFGSGRLQTIGWWLASWSFVPMVMIPPALVLLMFPNGRLPSSRWRVFAWIGLIGTASWSIAEMTRPVLGRTDLDNPLANSRLEVGGDLVSIILIAGLVAAGMSIVVRFRHARGDERLQLKWITFAAIVMLIALGAIWFVADVAQASFGGREIAAGTLAVGLLFVAIAAAILRYRLYDIERLISRTLSYTLVAGLMATVYALVAIALPQLLGLGDQSALATAGGTLAVAALFRPVATRLMLAMDRRFNRTRFDAQREVDGFTSTLGRRLELEGVLGSLSTVVTRTVAPVSVGIWIR